MPAARIRGAAGSLDPSSACAAVSSEDTCEEEASWAGCEEGVDNASALEETSSAGALEDGPLASACEALLETGGACSGAAVLSAWMPLDDAMGDGISEELSRAGSALEVLISEDVEGGSGSFGSSGCDDEEKGGCEEPASGKSSRAREEQEAKKRLAASKKARPAFIISHPFVFWAVIRLCVVYYNACGVH